jgi:hypothetical protein
MTDDSTGTTPVTTTESAPTTRLPINRSAKGRKGPVAPASRALTAGLSVAATCAIIATFALGAPVQGAEAPAVALDVTASGGIAGQASTPALLPDGSIVPPSEVPVGAAPGSQTSSSGASTGSATAQPAGGTSAGSTSGGSTSAAAPPATTRPSAATPAPVTAAPAPVTAAPTTQAPRPTTPPTTARSKAS